MPVGMVMLNDETDRPAAGSIKGKLMSAEPPSIQSRLMALRQEHRDLDHAISLLAESPSTDQLQLRRMKKRKLRLRDQIAYWESKLIPDLDA